MFLRSMTMSVRDARGPLCVEVQLDILCSLEEANRFQQWMQGGVPFTAEPQETMKLGAGKKRLPAGKKRLPAAEPRQLPREAGVVDGEFEEP